MKKYFTFLLRLLPSQPTINIETISEKNNHLICYRLYDGGYQRIQALDNFENASPLSETLFQPPQHVQFKGKCFDLTLPGVYRFYRLNDVSEQRLVVDGTIKQLLECMGYLWKYGFEKMVGDKQLDAKKVQNHIFVAGCVDIAVIASQIFKNFGINSRILSFQTLNPWGGQDDGHTVLEVLGENGDWFVYDPSFSAVFLHKNKKLNAFDLQRQKILGEDIVVKLFSGSIGPAQFKHSNYDYGFWVEERFHDEKALNHWFDNIMNVCLFTKDGDRYFASSNLHNEDIKRMETLGFYPISDDELESAFYQR